MMKHEVNPWVWHKICLKFCDVDIEGTIKAQRCCERGDDLRQETVEICICGALDVQVATTNVIESLIVIHDGYISVFEQRVNTEHGVVWLHNSCSNLWACPNSEANFRFLAIVD